MGEGKGSLRPGELTRSLRHRLSLKAEFTLAVLPTAVVLLVFAVVELLSHNRLLFASLASSAFLIYLDPQHGTNQVRTLVLSQGLAAVTGYAAHALTGGGYAAGGVAMIALITMMILLDAMHPPAVATALSFAFRPGDESNVALFGLSLALVAILVVLQRSVLWVLIRLTARHPDRGGLSTGRQYDP